MTRRLAVLLAVAALAAAAAEDAATAEPSITATMRPATTLFGDPFSYVVEVRVDAADAPRARIVDDVGPFARIGPTRTERLVANGVATITQTETLACLSAACLPSSASGRSVSLPQARVVVDGTSVVAHPATVRVGTRVSPAEIKAGEPPFRRPRGLPAVGYRVSPGAAEMVLAAAGIVLLAGALLGLALPILRRRKESARTTADADQVARAVRLLRESADRDATARRRAAGLAARVVARPDVSLDAATVAWSRPDPAPPDAATLADRVEHATETPA